MKARHVLRSLVESEGYDTLINLVDETPHGHLPRGVVDFTDFLAEVLNGGISQYVWNDYGHEFRNVISFLQQVNGVKTGELMNLALALDPRPDKLNAAESQEFFEDPPSWDALENWLYDDRNSEALYAEVLKHLQWFIRTKSTASVTSHPRPGPINRFPGERED